MNIRLKIKLGKDPSHLLVFERQGELYECVGVRLFICQPSLTNKSWRVFCAKTGLGFGDVFTSKSDALESAVFKFKVYGENTVRLLVEEGCKDGGFINEELLKDIKSLKGENSIDIDSKII